MYEALNISFLTAPQAAVVFAALLGLAFGILGEQTKFCFRRALIGEDRRAAAGVWFMALAAAVLGTQVAMWSGVISFEGHRLLAADLPIVSIAVGGAMFGAGMVLTRGCASRLTVLSGTGNLRALTVLVIFAVIAHATLKGVLAPLRVWLGSFTLPVGEAASLAALPFGTLLAPALIIAAALFVALRSHAQVWTLAGAAALGLLVPVAWVGTGYVLYDDFDPIAMQSLSFTLPWADSLFWTVASSAIPAGFGVGLIGGVLAGGAVSSLAAGRFAWQSFDSPRQTGRYGAGAVLMGAGGVLAGGCTVGAGLSGIPMLSVAAVLTVVFIALGALGTQAALKRRGGVANVQPAE